MKKIIAVIPIAILFILLSPTYLTYADTLNQILANEYYTNISYLQQYWNDDPNQGTYYYVCCSYDSNFIIDNRNNINNNITLHKQNFVNYSTYRFSVDPLLYPDYNTYSSFSTNSANGFLVVNLKGTIIDNSTSDLVFESIDDYEDYLNPPEPEPDPTWFEIWSNRIYEFLDDWIPWATDLDHWLDDIYLDLFGMKLDGDDVQYGNDIEFYDFPSPTPFPTQIPYQEQIMPDGNGGFTIQYIYPDPSGNPITASAPPPEPTYIIKITDSPQYDISGVPVPPADGLQDAIDAIDDNIDDYQEGFEAIQGSFSALPVKWFFFFGIPAAIILIAGIIRSLLGG